MKPTLRSLAPVTAIILAAIFTSCDPSPPPPPNPGPTPVNDPPTVASISWQLQPSGGGYDLDVIIDGVEHHGAAGGEYVRGHRIGRVDGVPTSSLSAYEVDMPDGEAMLYWVERHGHSAYSLYSRFWDPVSSRHHQPRLVRTIHP